MPTSSYREQTLSDINTILWTLIVNDEEESEEFADMTDLYVAVESHRFLNARSTIPQSKALTILLLQYGDSDFRKEVRMTKVRLRVRNCFLSIVDIYFKI
jgi:hypothetical protein